MTLDPKTRAGLKNVTEWFAKISSLPEFVKVCGKVKMAQVQLLPNGESLEEAVEEEKKKEDDDDLDLFGDDDEEDAEAAKKAAEKAKEAAAGKKKKKEVIAMSLVMLEVKPLDSETNLDDLAQKIFKEITQPGLFWKTEYKKEPIAFGIEKLIIGFSCEDEKVSVDNDVVEKIEAMEDVVQSVEIQAFNKI